MSLDDIKVRIVCPLGMKSCREVKDNEIHQCAWYVKLAGKNPQSTETVDEWRCAMAWQPILLVENAQTNRGQTVALESFRNEVVAQENKLIHAIARAQHQQEKVIMIENGGALE